MKFLRTLQALIAASSLTVACGAVAADYPQRPVKAVIGFGTGSGIDTTMRMLGEKFQAITGQPLVVEAHPGAGGNLASRYVARAEPDGYTIFPGSVGMLAINPLVYSDPGYDPIKDFDLILRTTRQHLVLAVDASLPAKNLQEFIDYVAKRPQGVTFGSFGAGSESHFLGELFAEAAKVKMVHAPYKGSLAAVTDLLGGHIDSVFTTYASVLPHVESGRLRVLAVASAKRPPLMSDIPTFAEQGFPQLEAYAWSGLVVPKGTPLEIREFLEKTFNEILTMPDIKQKLESMGHEVTANTTEEFTAFVEADRERWKRAVAVTGFHAD